jgi:hypothetical protein
MAYITKNVKLSIVSSVWESDGLVLVEVSANNAPLPHSEIEILKDSVFPV